MATSASNAVSIHQAEARQKAMPKLKRILKARLIADAEQKAAKATVDKLRAEALPLFDIAGVNELMVDRETIVKLVRPTGTAIDTDGLLEHLKASGAPQDVIDMVFPPVPTFDAEGMRALAKMNLLPEGSQAFVKSTELPPRLVASKIKG